MLPQHTYPVLSRELMIERVCELLWKPKPIPVSSLLSTSYRVHILTSLKLLKSY